MKKGDYLCTVDEINILDGEPCVIDDPSLHYSDCGYGEEYLKDFTKCPYCNIVTDEILERIKMTEYISKSFDVEEIEFKKLKEIYNILKK